MHIALSFTQTVSISKLLRNNEESLGVAGSTLTCTSVSLVVHTVSPRPRALPFALKDEQSLMSAASLLASYSSPDLVGQRQLNSAALIVLCHVHLLQTPSDSARLH